VERITVPPLAVARGKAPAPMAGMANQLERRKKRRSWWLRGHSKKLLKLYLTGFVEAPILAIFGPLEITERAKVNEEHFAMPLKMATSPRSMQDWLKMKVVILPMMRQVGPAIRAKVSMIRRRYVMVTIAVFTRPSHVCRLMLTCRQQKRIDVRHF
jgi:hypothetical protein